MRTTKLSCMPFWLLVVGVLVFGPVTAWSIPLTAPGDYTLPGTTPRPGLVLEDLMTPYSFSGAGETLTGQIRNRVVRFNDDGTLGFIWQITADPFNEVTNNGDVLAFRVGGFAGFPVDADYSPTSVGTVPPNLARCFGLGTGAVNFLFETDQVGAGESSRMFRLETQATEYGLVAQFDLLGAPSGCVSPLYDTFGPTIPAVPEPTSLLLLSSGLTAAGLGRRHRRRQ